MLQRSRQQQQQRSYRHLSLQVIASSPEGRSWCPRFGLEAMQAEGHVAGKRMGKDMHE